MKAKEKEPSAHPRGDSADGGGGGGARWLVTCLSHLTVDHASVSFEPDGHVRPWAGEGAERYREPQTASFASFDVWLLFSSLAKRGDLYRFQVRTYQ